MKTVSTHKTELVRLGAVLVGLALAVYIGNIVYNSFTYESTDDAQVAAHVATLSTKVGGMVVEIPSEQNQTVKANDPLIVIEATDYMNRTSQAEAELASIEARIQEADKNNRRMRKLVETDSVSIQQADQAESVYRDLVKKRDAMMSQVNQAKLDLSRTTLRAPTDGKVGKRSVEKGVTVAPGQALITFVQADHRWIEANFKETQIRRMRVGQTADIEIDAVEGHHFEGTVESFSPASGATFSVLPPENATGNFVKIVQRVPVRIAIKEESMKGFEDRFLPGLSCNVKVRIR